MGSQNVRHDWVTELTWTEVMFDSLWLDELQHIRLPCPSWFSGGLFKLMSTESEMPSNHLILCQSLLPFPSVFPSIKVFSNELALCIRGQSIGTSGSVSVFPMNIQDWFPLRLTVISLMSNMQQSLIITWESLLKMLGFLSLFSPLCFTQRKWVFSTNVWNRTPKVKHWQAPLFAIVDINLSP